MGPEFGSIFLNPVDSRYTLISSQFQNCLLLMKIYMKYALYWQFLLPGNENIDSPTNNTNTVNSQDLHSHYHVPGTVLITKWTHLIFIITLLLTHRIITPIMERSNVNTRTPYIFLHITSVSDFLKIGGSLELGVGLALWT